MPVALSIELSTDLMASARAAAEWRDLSLEDYVRAVIEKASGMDVELATFVKEGLDAADRGELVSQKEMEAWFEMRHRPAAAE